MKKVVIYGNCQADGIFDLLKQLPQVTERFSLAYHFVRSAPEDVDRQRQEAQEADVLLAQDIGDWSYYAFRDDYRPDTQIVRFPFLYLASLWPFDSHQNPPDTKAQAEFGQHSPWDFPFQDSLLGRLRAEEPDPERRFETYRELTVDGLPNLVRYHEAETARLRLMDRKSDYGLGQYVIDNFRQKSLFHTITHPTAHLLMTVAARILAPVGLELDIDAPVSDRLSVFQPPLHPLVADKLNLEWVTPEQTYSFYGRPVDFDTYVRKYIEVYG
ncbi:hypothetical protein DMC18_01235 [Caulobacter sp. D5]|uniref:WcbI family polysaccharide biosynthesis putative acetyltransferase n=1 Tax=Caulobacter sp. D5 TaxID=357400 RepID=UPI000D73CD97|nr:WcbI family polysaccharide biosynthesis putative acetyltransferase [Caulobacter sp. D5]PXA96506.1 hypothetical protein DMC18_01235 [Caulobacter sp. D5]